MAAAPPLAMVYCPFGSKAEAERVSRDVVTRRLAACANILGETVSIYEWQDSLETASETAVLFKTAADKAGPLIAAIEELHSYDEPAIVNWPVDKAAAGFADWVVTRTREHR